MITVKLFVGSTTQQLSGLEYSYCNSSSSFGPKAGIDTAKVMLRHFYRQISIGFVQKQKTEKNRRKPNHNSLRFKKLIPKTLFLEFCFWDFAKRVCYGTKNNDLRICTSKNFGATCYTVSKNKIPKRRKYLLSPGGAHAKFFVFGFDKTPCYGFQKLFSKKFVMTPPLHFHHNHISIIHGLYL